MLIPTTISHLSQIWAYQSSLKPSSLHNTEFLLRLVEEAARLYQMSVGELNFQHIFLANLNYKLFLCDRALINLAFRIAVIWSIC